MGTVAIDIETISPGVDESTEVDFLNSREFELLCVGLGYRATPTSEPELEVLWRPGIDTGDEYQLLARFAEWLAEHPVDKILTYNGTDFDIRHLRGRASIISDEVRDPSLPELLHRELTVPTHRDLMHDVIRKHGHRLSLEDAVEAHVGERPPDTRWRGELISNSDIPSLGEEWLTHRSGLVQLDHAENLKATLEEYVNADIDPLFSLADVFDGREHPETESTREY